jgi:hypothetical protein
LWYIERMKSESRSQVPGLRLPKGFGPQAGVREPRFGDRRLSSPSFRREQVPHGTRDPRVRGQRSLTGRSKKLRGFFVRQQEWRT